MTNKPSWRDELRDKFEGANDLSSSNGIDWLIAFIQDLLDRKVREIEGLKDLKQKSDRWRYSAGEVNCFNQALDQAISILKEE